ncbi:hypothetical protein RMATCC62417_06988 [Rhizopus microsporus]|nr:hypothetical protein RMATCC62417_06988 [Rhizopus microsporus]
MPGFNEIPSEILQKIFTYVQKSDEYKKNWMVQYQLVCKGWNQVAKTWLYSSVDLYDDTDMERFLHCMKNSSAGHLTRTICLSTRYRKYEAAELYMNELVEACPNVERVKDAIGNYDSWRTIATAASKHWPHIKEIINPFDLTERHNYFDCYNTLISLFRHSLTQIYLPPEHPSTPIMKELCQRLPEFSNLTHLIIDKMEAIWSLIDYDEIIQLCPNLTSLSVNSKAFYSRERSRIPTTLEILSTQPHKNIKTLGVYWINHIGIAEYIMHKFPSLQNLKLVSNSSFRFDLEGYFNDIGDRFIEYLNSIQTYEIEGRGPFSLLEAYLKHTPNVCIHFCYLEASKQAIRLQQRGIKRTAFIQFDNDPRKKERFLQMFKKYQHNITRFILDFDEYSEDRTAWIEDILTTCTQMKAFHYWTYATFQPPSQGAIDANVPLNSTLETLTLRVHTIESGSLAGYLRLLPSVRHVNVKITCPSMDEVESRLDMLFDSFDTAPSNTWSPQSHYSSLTDVFGRKALLVIDDDFSDKTIYLVDIQRENRTTTKWTETVNENPLIKVFVEIDLFDEGIDYNNLYYDDLYE